MKIKFLLTVTVVLTEASLNAQPDSNRAYSMFHADPMHSGNYPSKNYKTIGNVKWKFKTGGKIFSSPAVVNDIAFIGSEDNNLYAIDIRSGKQKWKFKTGGEVNSSAAVYNNTVYFGSFDGYYYAVDIISGKLKWKLKTGGEKWMGGKAYWGMKPADIYMNDLWDFFLSSPVVGKIAGNSIVYFGSSDGNVYALDAKDGELKWKFKTNGSIHTSPALYSNTIYIGNWDGLFYAIDAQTGKEKWKFKTGEQQAMTGIQASATLENGVVYFSARDAHMYALDAANGTLLWKYDAENSWILSTAAIKDHVLYTGTSDTYLLLALDANTGKEKFRFKTNGYVYGSPAVAGGAAFFGDFTGKMYALDLNTGGRNWTSFSTNSRKQNAASILKEDTLNFEYAAKGADLTSYVANKKVMDDFYRLGSIVSSPVVKDGVLYFGSADGYLYALHLKE
jgi:eukaryotic-like serine/threonine-protein kinase